MTANIECPNGTNVTTTIRCLNIHGTHVTANIECLYGTNVTTTIRCLNIHGTHVTANILGVSIYMGPMQLQISQLLIMLCSFKGGARGVMAIVEGNGHGDTSSNPGRD